MTTLSRTASLWVARTGLAFVLLSFALLGLWTAGELFGQPPDQKKERVEEEEDAPKAKASSQKKRTEKEEAPRDKAKRKVIRVDDEEDAKSKSETNRPSAQAAGGSLDELAKQATHRALKEFYSSLAVPHDRVVYQPSRVRIGGGQQRRADEKIVPTPFYIGNDPGRYRHERLSFTLLTSDGEKAKSYEPLLENIEFVRPYEEIAQEKVQKLLRETRENYGQREKEDPLYLSRSDALQAARQALSSVLSWHESAIQISKRSGKDWEEVEKKLRDRLLEVMLEQMKELANAGNWEAVIDLTHRLAVSYGNADERIFRPVADMLQQAINNPTNTEETKQQAFKRLHDLEMEFPNNPALQPLSKMRQARAEAFRTEAEKLAQDKEDPAKRQRAFEYLKQAEEAWPQLKGLGELRSRIGMDYPILRVGVRGQLPKYYSPAWACTDNERRVLELLYESLVKLVPDGSGGFRYRPCLAEFPPQVVPLGRQFDLPRNAYWSNGMSLKADDIQSSLVMLRNGKGVDLPRAWGSLLAPKVETMKNPFQLTLRMNQGFLDPLAPMTFKILPRDKYITREDFAVDPITSGPFRLDRERSGKSDETQRLALVFVANRVYGQRPAKHGTPHIQEIRFYPYAEGTDLAKELKSRNLDLVLDLTANQAEQLQKNQGTDLVVPLPSPDVPNRRIYFLAINTRKLEDPKLRQALSFAIDREGLLNKHFRGSLKGLHKALSGPFPAGSWACKPAKEGDKDGQKLFDPERAKLQKPQGRTLSFQLKYAADNPAVEEALKDLCAKVKELTGVVLEPTRRTPYQLRDEVEKSKDYELAYYHYDFPDECYWLAPLFGPPPGAADINMFKYNNTDLSRLLDGTKSFRDFAKVREHQWLTQDLLNREMPFIPLWQLDPLLAYRRSVEPTTLDPLLVFDNIEDWHLLPK